MEKDELEDLFVKKDELLDKTLLKESIMKYAKLTNEGELIPGREFYNLPNLKKVIVFLLARKVLKVKNVIEEEEIGPTELSKSIGIPVGSVKTIFHSTKDILFVSVSGKYKMPNYAIQKACDYLNKVIKESSPKKTKKPSKKGSSEIVTSISASDSESVKKVKNKLNRTEYPIMYELNIVLDKSLYLLKIVKDKLDIDGLTPPEMSYILTNIFRIGTSRQSIGIALMKSKYVHRVEKSKEGAGRSTYIYKIMKPGEDYLEEVMNTKNK